MVKSVSRKLRAKNETAADPKVPRPKHTSFC